MWFFLGIPVGWILRQWYNERTRPPLRIVTPEERRIIDQQRRAQRAQSTEE